MAASQGKLRTLKKMNLFFLRIPLVLQTFGVWVLFFWPLALTFLCLILIERPVVNVFQYRSEHQAL